MANSVLAKMAVVISANTAEFNSKIGQANKSLASINKTVSVATRGLAALGVVFSAGVILKGIFDLGVKAEQTAIAFNTFLGSATKGKQILKELTEFSVATPFSPDAVNSAAKALLSFGVQAKEILPTLKFLGDVSSGTGKDLTELAIIFGQIRSTGRLMGQDLLQLINAGFNPLQQIAQDTGKSVGELKKEMEKGNISFKQVETAFKNATSEGGLFFNLMEKQSVTIGGKISTLKGNFDELGKTFFALGSGPVPFLVGKLNDLAIKANELLKITSFEDIADVGLKKFRDKLVEIDGLLSSTNAEIKQSGVQLGNFFAVDLVNAINEANEDLKTASDFAKILENTGNGASKEYKALQNRISILKAELAGLNEVKIDLFKLLRVETKEFFETLDSLKKKKSELETQFNSQTSITDKKELTNIGLKIQAINKQIEALERLKRVNAAPTPQTLDPFGGLSLTPSGNGQINSTGLLPFQEEAAAYIDSIKETADTFISYQELMSKRAAEEQQKIRDQWEQSSNFAVAFGSIVGDSFAGIITGQQSFVQSLARITETIVQEYGRQAIASIIAKAAASSGPFPFVAVAKAAAGVALISGLLRAAAGYKGKSGGGGFTSSSSRSSFSAFAQDSGEVRIIGTTQIKGQDLHVVWSNYNKNSGSTRNG